MIRLDDKVSPGITVIYIEKKRGKRTYKRVTLPIMELLEEEEVKGTIASPVRFYLPKAKEPYAGKVR